MMMAHYDRIPKDPRDSSYRKWEKAQYFFYFPSSFWEKSCSSHCSWPLKRKLIRMLLSFLSSLFFTLTSLKNGLSLLYCSSSMYKVCSNLIQEASLRYILALIKSPIRKETRFMYYISLLFFEFQVVSSILPAQMRRFINWETYFCMNFITKVFIFDAIILVSVYRFMYSRIY